MNQALQESAIRYAEALVAFNETEYREVPTSEHNRLYRELFAAQMELNSLADAIANMKAETQ